MYISNHMPLFSLSDIWDIVSNVGSEVSDIFHDTGSWCAELVNSALSLYQNFVNVGLKVIQRPVDSVGFTDFWTVIDLISKVFGIVGTSIILFAFLYRVMDEALQQQMDIWTFGKSVIRLNLGVVLVNNALTIVKAILNAGVEISNGIYRLVSGTSADFADPLTLDDISFHRLATGVSGMKALFTFLLYLFGALVIVVCGVVIVVAVYQRIFTIFMLIPFAPFSIATFPMPDWKGHEIFQGYVKSILKTSLEAVLITSALAFSFILIHSGTTMQELFPADLDDTQVTITVRNSSELNVLYYSREYGRLPIGTSQFDDAVSWDELSDEVLSVINYNRNKEVVTQTDSDNVFNGINSGISSVFGTIGLKKYNNAVMTFDGHDISGSQFRIMTASADRQNYPATLVIYGELSWLGILTVLLRIVFPCVVAASCIKGIEGLSAKIVGGY